MTLAEKTSIIVPFYNTPLNYFYECIASIKACKPKEIILVDDYSTNQEVVKLAKQSGCTYIKIPFQSGHDGLPFNIGIKYANGEYICRVDSDDLLLSLPKKINCEIHFAKNKRVYLPQNLTVEQLILAPRALCGGMVVKREILLRYPYPTDKNVFGDVLFTLQALYNKHTFSINSDINYIYRKREGSIQTSYPKIHHRYRNIQTVARFCALQKIHPQQAKYFLDLAMLNFKFGSKSLNLLKSHHQKLF